MHPYIIDIDLNVQQNIMMNLTYRYHHHATTDGFNAQQILDQNIPSEPWTMENFPANPGPIQSSLKKIT
jgi:hypothetical protein